MNDTLTIDHVKAMWAAIQAMKQPEYVVLANKNDPMLPEYRKLGYEVWVFEDDTLPAVEEGNVLLLDKSMIPTEKDLLDRLEKEKPKFEWERMHNE